MNAIVDTKALEAIELLKKDWLAHTREVASEFMRPSVIMRPTLTRTSNDWKATYGDFAAYGATPSLAMASFDSEWFNKRVKR